MQHYALQPPRPRAPKSFETRRGRVGNATEPTFCCKSVLLLGTGQAVELLGSWDAAKKVSGGSACEKFAIGQRAYLVQTSEGNVLWDCIALIDEATVETVRSLGGIFAIAISHPHYYTTMVEWSRAFGNAPIYLHEDSRKWIMHPDKVIHFWNGDARQLIGGLTLIRTGGHFKGFQVLHSPWHGGGRGALFAGDSRVCAWTGAGPRSCTAIPILSRCLRPLFARLCRG